jgi:hypothetical protein
MTESQAHKFIERLEKVSFPQRWRAKTEAETARRLKGLFIGFMCGAIAVMLTSFGELLVEVFALLFLSFLFWLTLRLHKAICVLGYS